MPGECNRAWYGVELTRLLIPFEVNLGRYAKKNSDRGDIFPGLFFAASGGNFGKENGDG